MPSVQNWMANDASRLFHISDDEFLSFSISPSACNPVTSDNFMRDLRGAQVDVQRGVSTKKASAGDRNKEKLRRKVKYSNFMKESCSNPF